MMLVNTFQGPLWLILQPPLAAIQLGFFLAFHLHAKGILAKRKFSLGSPRFKPIPCQCQINA